MAAVALGYFIICLIELFVGFAFEPVPVQTAGRTLLLVFLL